MVLESPMFALSEAPLSSVWHWHCVWPSLREAGPRAFVSKDALELQAWQKGVEKWGVLGCLGKEGIKIM